VIGPSVPRERHPGLADARRFRLHLSNYRRFFGVAILLLWSVAVGVVIAQDLGSPPATHTDEPGKVAQILSSQYNLRHPQLMLTLTQVYRWAATIPLQPQPVVEAGRMVSAVAAAVSVLLLALAAWRLAGAMAAMVAALLVGAHPLLFGLAHYMKEDAVLMMGLSVFFLVLVHEDRLSGRTRSALLGIGAGLAASAKYAGLIALPMTFLILHLDLQGTRRRAWAQSGEALAWAVAVFALADLPLLGEPARAWISLRREVDGHLLLPATMPAYLPPYATIYAGGLVKTCTPIILLGYGFWLIHCWWHRSALPLAHLMMAVFPVAYLLLLQLVPSKFPRYLLPVAVTMTMMAACGFAQVFASSAGRLRRQGLLLALIAVAVFDLWELRRTVLAIREDNRVRVAEWIRGALPIEDVILQVTQGGLVEARPATARWEVPNRVITQDLDEMGSLDALRALGVTHILLIGGQYGRAVAAGIDGGSGGRDADISSQRRAFYLALARQATIVQALPPVQPWGTSFSPDVQLFDIRSAHPAASF
jgi:hypothetical protein